MHSHAERGNEAAWLNSVPLLPDPEIHQNADVKSPASLIQIMPGAWHFT
jgi:hypothetical protein